MKISEMNVNEACRVAAASFAMGPAAECDPFWEDCFTALAAAAKICIMDPQDAQVDLMQAPSGLKFVRVYYKQLIAGSWTQLICNIAREGFGEFIRMPKGSRKLMTLHHGGINY